ncbi:MAG: glutathione peroxidase [Comamonas sp.]|nr:glutathione peroxidase [Comamonas sp.]
MPSFYDFSAPDIAGIPQAMSQFAGKVVLVVNTASACGFTPQLSGLQQLHERYAAQGLAVLGFPCNQFGQQDKGSNTEIGSFCQRNYGVAFPMMAKVEVNGSQAHPLFAWLKAQAPGLLGTQMVKWNFTKFLIARDGQVIQRYAPNTAPASIASDIEAALAQPPHTGA